MTQKKLLFKAAVVFVDAPTGIHYAKGDPIDPRTLQASDDAEDRTESLVSRGLIVDIDAKLPTRNPTDDGTLIDRFEVREGETIEDARERAGLPKVEATVNTSKAAKAAAKAGKEGEK